MFLKHKVRVNVMTPGGEKSEALESGEMTLPARLVRFLFGDGMKVLVITPHSAVGEVVISEMEEKEDETDEG
ncbi:MAG: hypothetical protein LUH14_05870 [Clostridiaceae bacterium]|nr:hypothetical protein [Clostridiaceae bacterium]